MKRCKIVAIEDEADILKVIEYNLEREGFRVVGTGDGERGLELIRREHPDLVLLDLMLPGLDGLDVCRSLKADPVTRCIPVIMVTAKRSESDIVLGLGIGADDYITKPFRIHELIARINAVLRRVAIPENEPGKGQLIRGPLIIDAAGYKVSLAGNPVDLTVTQFRLLEVLAAHPGRVFTRDQLLNRAIGEDAIVADRNIDVHVRAIRKKLAAHAGLVETVRGIGYRFSEGYE